jgi:mannosyltransferase
VLGLVAVGACLRFGTLHVQSLWYDEAVSASLVRRSFVGMLRALPDSESTPPLWYVLEWIWVRVFGTSEVGLRSLSALLGTLFIAVAFETARAFGCSERVAIAVAAFISLSPIMVWYSQEARAYALYVFLAALSMLFFARALAQATPRALWLWAASAALALTAHYFAVFVVAVEAVVLLRQVGMRRRAAQLLAVVGVGAALLPLALYQNEHVVSQLSIESSSVWPRLREIVIRYAVMFTDPGGTAVLIATLSAAALLTWRARTSRSAQILLVLGSAVIGLPLLLAVAHVVDVFNFRNALAAWLPVVIVLAAGLPAGRAGVALTGVIAAALLTATLAIAVAPGPQRDSWRDVARVIDSSSGRRIIAGETGELTYTLPYYAPQLRPLPVAGIRVREIDLVGHVDADWRLPRLPQFRLAHAEKAGNLMVVRLAAPRSVSVIQDDLDAGGFLLGLVDDG